MLKEAVKSVNDGEMKNGWWDKLGAGLRTASIRYAKMDECSNPISC